MLANFTLTGIPPMKAGLARVEVTFAIDANGQLSVSAMEIATKVASKIDVVPSYGLSEEQQEELLKAGFTHAKADKEKRMLIETKVEAEREVLALQSALVEFGNLLNDDNKANLTEKMSVVKSAIDAAQTVDDKAMLDKAVSELKPLSDRAEATCACSTGWLYATSAEIPPVKSNPRFKPLVVMAMRLAITKMAEITIMGISIFINPMMRLLPSSLTPPSFSANSSV